YPADVKFRKEPGGDGPHALLYLFTLKGDSSLKVDYQNHALPAGSQFSWSKFGGPAKGADRTKVQLKWYTDPPSDKEPGVKDMQTALRDLAARVYKKENAAPVVAFNEMTREPKIAARILGVRCLGAVDDLGDLTTCLKDDKPDVRLAAIEVLRHW